MPTNEKRPDKYRVVAFEQGVPAHMLAIDGTWRRACNLNDVSELGATLVVKASIEGLGLREFFLVLSSTGLAYRRCELNWVNGDQIGVTFIKQRRRETKSGESDSI